MSSLSVDSRGSFRSGKSLASLRSRSSPNRSTSNLQLLTTSIVSAGDQIALSPQPDTNLNIGDGASQLNKESSFLDFELSKDEIEELLGASHSIFSNDPSLSGLPPMSVGLETSSTALSQVTTQELLAIPSKEPRKKKDFTKVVGYKPVHSQELNLLHGVQPPTSKFKYMAKSNMHNYHLQENSDIGMSTSFSKVSLVLSEEEVIPQPRSLVIPRAQLTGKYFSKTNGVVATHQASTSLIHTRIHSPKEKLLHVEAHIEPMPSVFSLQSNKPGRSVSPRKNSTSVEELIAIPTARARTPKSRGANNETSPSMYMNDEADVEPEAPTFNQAISADDSHAVQVPEVLSKSQVQRELRKNKGKVERIAYVLSPSRQGSHESRAEQRQLRTHSRLEPILRAQSAGMNNPRATSPSPEPLARSSSHVEQSVESEGSRFVSHRKMLGWKLTSVSKRKELLELLDVLTHQQGKQRQHVLSPVGRKKQLLLNQLEQELLSTSQSMLLSPPKDLSQLHHASLDAVTRSSSRSLVHRQSEALEKYLSRSLQSKLSYKTKVGIDFQMKERKMVKDLLHGIKTPASALRPITPSQPHGLQEPYGGIYTAYDDGQHLAQPSIQEEMTAHSQGILALTMQVFPQPSRPSSTDPLLLRPASRFINTRSRQSPSRGKSRQSSNSRRSRSRSREKKDNVKQEVSKVIYDLPYNLHRPIDRMDILQSVYVRSQLAPIVRPTETDPSQLFNPDYTQSILNPPAPAADKDGDDNLLAEYFDSSNRILRMLSQDQGDDSAMEGVLRSNSELFAEASQQTYHSSMAQDDELVDAFIEERYKVARMKKQKTQKQQPSESPRHREGGDDQEGEKGEEGEDENFKWQHADSQDDHSVGNQSLSSLGDQSAAVYDLILPTASSAIPPPKTRSNTINTITTLPSLNSSSLPKELEYQAANARNDTLSPSNSFASPVDETGLVDAEGMPILSGQHDIPVNPW